jgi:murein tripeptide amidase MpaA
MTQTKFLIVLFSIALYQLSNAETTLHETEPIDETGLKYQVIRVVPKTEEQLAYLKDLYKAQVELKLDFWVAPAAVGRICDVMMDTSALSSWLVERLTEMNIPYTITIEDVQMLVRERKVKHDFNRFLSRRRKRDVNAPFYDFHTYGEYHEMIAYMKDVVQKYPNIAQLRSIGGITVDGNQIYMMKIGNKNAKTVNRRAVWVDGGIHAREWASPHVVMYLINTLTSEYSRNETIRRYVDNLDFYLTPVVNPDGYIYSHSSDSPSVRMWRKNRNNAIDTSDRCKQSTPKRNNCCLGTDLNRNFDFHWGESGSSTDACSEIFQGKTPFSEVESQAIRDTLIGSELNGRVDMFVTLHTYSQLWLHPYGHAPNNYPADMSELLRVGNLGAKALAKRYNTPYKVGSGADALYSAAGGSDDWAKSVAGVKYTYLLELRPDDNHWDGFILEEEALVPTALETWDGLRTVIDEVMVMNGLDKLPLQPLTTTQAPQRQTNRPVTTTTEDNPEESNLNCFDQHAACARWTQSQPNLCQSASNFMNRVCARSCKSCRRNLLKDTSS